MRFLRFGGGPDKELRSSGTRVPAALVGIHVPRTDDPNRTYTMHWVAHTPEGGTVPFKVRSKWCPPEGIYLEAACDEARERAVLILDLARMPKEMSRYGPAVAESEAAAARLRGGDASGGLMHATMQKFGLAPKLRDLKG